MNRAFPFTLNISPVHEISQAEGSPRLRLQTEHDPRLASVLARLAKGRLENWVDGFEEDLGAERAQVICRFAILV